MFPSKTFVLIILFSAALVACGPGQPAPADAPPGLTAWVDAPLDGSTIPEAAYNLVFSAASSNGQVDQFEIQVNGIAVDTVSPVYEAVEGEAKYYYGQYEWLPPAPGTYLIEVVAMSGDEMSPYAQTQVIVGGAEIAAEPPPDELPADEEFPPDPVMPMFDTAMFYYGGSCSPNQIQTEIQVPDPEAFSVVMFYRLRGMNGQSELRTDWEAIAMNPGSEGYWRRTIPSSAVPDRHMFQSAYFQVQIVGTYQSGEEFLRGAVVANQILLLACGEAPPEEAPPGDGDVAVTQCNDGIDNDGDGDIDMADGGCSSPEDNNEFSVVIVPVPPTITPIPPPS